MHKKEKVRIEKLWLKLGRNLIFSFLDNKSVVDRKKFVLCNNNKNGCIIMQHSYDIFNIITIVKMIYHVHLNATKISKKNSSHHIVCHKYILQQCSRYQIDSQYRPAYKWLKDFYFITNSSFLGLNAGSIK